MKRIIATGAVAALAAVGFAGTANAGGPPEGAGDRGKPAGITCQQFGVGVLQSLGVLPSVAKNGLEYPIGSENFIPFATVLDIHRTDTGTANVVLKAYSDALNLGADEAIDTACPA
jgi:hypothetical protein